jgi:flagellar basal-body rod protein FlgG
LFINPAGLKQIGENLYTESAASGAPLVGEPGDDNRGRIMQNRLEASNVDPTRELIELIRTQRAFEMNSQTIRSADETLRAVAQLRR